MSARSVANPPGVVADERIVVPRVSWETYNRLIEDDPERRVPRLTYDRGVLELVTPSMPHEQFALTIIRLVDIVSAMLEISIRSVGSTTYRRQDLERGFEPDASFYIQHEPSIRNLEEVNLAVDPPPDLVLEMEMSRSALNKLALFWSMGIPEVWRYDGERITIHVLTADTYSVSSSSNVLPVLTCDTITRFLAQSREMPSHQWFQMVSDWARAQR
jgi:Uma2 family endonuclease